MNNQKPQFQNHLQQSIAKIYQLIKNNEFSLAENVADGLLALNPENLDILAATGYVKLHLPDKTQRGLSLLKKSFDRANAPEPYVALAAEFVHKKKIEVGENISRFVIERYPNHYNGLNVLGVSLKQQQRYAEAIATLKKAISILPNEQSAYNNLGNAYMEWQHYAEALEAFGNALKNDPKNPELIRMYAVAQNRLGNYEQSIPLLQKALEIAPNKAEIYVDLCSTYYQLRDFKSALEIINRIIAIFPNDMALLRTKAMILRPMGLVEEAVPLLHRVLAHDPNDVSTMLALANAYFYTLGDNPKAREYYYMAYRQDPNNLTLLQKMCHYLITVRSIDENESANLMEAHHLISKLINLSFDPLAVEGAATSAQSIFLSTLDYESYNNLREKHDLIKHWKNKRDNSALSMCLSRVKTMQDRFDLIDVHRAWGEKEEEIAAREPIVHKVRQRLDNKIRIGIMSSDLRNHPVGYFAWPIIEHINRNEFELYTYSYYPHEAGALQKAFMHSVNSHKNYIIESNNEAAQSIADDQLDIMFELGGTTAYNRISVCAYKPAPVQVSWLGYPHSIGLPTTIDYIMVDPYINPQIKGLLIEKPFIMPKTWVVIEDKIGFKQVPILEQIPEDRNGYITLGTLNIPHKLTLESFKIWAELMHQIPNSRFLYVRPETDAPIFRENFLKHMGAHGIDHRRIAFGATRTAHLDYYNGIDIALDSFPHTGGTTTCECLWMGVPVVTLIGVSFFERISYSNLSNVGLDDLCALTLDEYKAKVMELVENKERRRYLRSNLRMLIKQNPLGKAKDFAHDFGQTIKQILGRG